MIKIICLLITLLSITGFSQEIYMFKSGGRVFDSKNQKISPDEVRDLLVNNQLALELYEAGRNKKTFGNVLLYGGIAMGIGKFIYDAKSPAYKVSTNGQLNYEVTSNVLYYVSGAIVLVAIPIKIGFSKKIKKAIEMLNENNLKPKTTSIESTSFIANNNGVGVSITF